MPVPPARFVPHAFARHPEPQMRARARQLCDELATRRSVRFFSDEPLPLDVVETCIETAASAPSGANRQPWTFALVTDPATKRAIRVAAEEEERRSYSGRMDDEWLAALEPLGTNAEKPFLESAPALIVLFRHAFGSAPGPWSVSGPVGERSYQNYYTQESAGIAAGFLIAALHHAGLATLTHTPSPMGFLAEVLRRPPNERAFLLLPVGYPARDCSVPDIRRKPLADVLVRYDAPA